MEDNSYQTGWTEKSAEISCCDMVSSSKGSSPVNFCKEYSSCAKMDSGVGSSWWMSSARDPFSALLLSHVIENWSTLSNYKSKLVIMTINSLKVMQLAHTTSRPVLRSRWPSQLVRNGKHLAFRILQACHLSNDKHKRGTCWGDKKLLMFTVRRGHGDSYPLRYLILKLLCNRYGY